MYWLCIFIYKCFYYVIMLCVGAYRCSMPCAVLGSVNTAIMYVYQRISQDLYLFSEEENVYLQSHERLFQCTQLVGKHPT